MLEHNVQDEFNIHNLKVFNLSEVRGGAIRKEGWETLFTMKRLFVLSFLLYLLVIPLLSKFSEKIRRLLQSLYIPIPWIWLGIYFVANVFMYRLFKGIAKYQGFENHGISELEELNFSFLLVLLPLLWINLPGPAFFKKGRTGKRKSAYIKAD